MQVRTGVMDHYDITRGNDHPEDQLEKGKRYLMAPNINSDPNPNPSLNPSPNPNPNPDWKGISSERQI